MLTFDDVKYSLQNIFHRKLRSFLSTLSILIGIMSIFALVSFGIGIQKYVNDLAAESGTDKLFVQSRSTGAPGTDESFAFTQAEVDHLDKIKGIDEYAGMYLSAVKADFDDETHYTFLAGMDPKKSRFIEEAFTVTVTKGRGLKKGDLKKVVLGYNYQLEDKIFQRAIKLGDKIKLNDVEYEVVGFYDEVGNPQDDGQIYLTDKAYENLFPDKENKYGFIMAKSQPGEDPQEVAEEVEDELRDLRGQEEGEEDFYVQTFADAIETFTAVINVIVGAIILIALISLIVAAINIMNTMYTAVTERTKEIGVMKAIGAKNSKITALFVFESGILGIIGGTIGILLGYLVAKLGGSIAASSGYASLQPYFPWWLIIGCILFAFITGSVAGLLPAIQASKLKPVDALRYE